jgi:hypothetical protein
MDKLHINSTSDNNFVPEEGQRDLMCSNKKSLRCPSLGLNNLLISEDVAIDYLAQVLVDIFLDKKIKENDKPINTKSTKGSDILPSINKRTS